MDKKNIKIRRIMGKKGDERFLTPWMFVIWGIIGIGLVAGVIIFYSADSDVREMQAHILSLRIADCIIDNGYLTKAFIEKKDVFSLCNIDKKYSDERKNIYFNISIKEIDNGKLVEEVIGGNKDISIQCGVRKKAEAELFARCSNENLYAVYSEKGVDKEVIVEVTAGSGNIGGKI